MTEYLLSKHLVLGSIPSTDKQINKQQQQTVGREEIQCALNGWEELSDSRSWRILYRDAGPGTRTLELSFVRVRVA